VGCVTWLFGVYAWMNEFDTWKWSILRASLFTLCNVLVALEIVAVLNCGGFVIQLKVYI